MTFHFQAFPLSNPVDFELQGIHWSQKVRTAPMLRFHDSTLKEEKEGMDRKLNQPRHQSTITKFRNYEL